MDFKTYVSTINSDLRILKGVGEKKSALFAKLGIFTLWDLLHNFPREYEDRTKFYKISDAPTDAPCCVEAVISRNVLERKIKKNISVYILRVSDGSGNMTVKWFSSPFNKNKLKTGERYVFFGNIKDENGRREMELKIAEKVGSLSETGCIVPVYSLTAGLTQKDFRKSVSVALDTVGEIAETMPPTVINRHLLMNKNEALREMHSPKNFDVIKEAHRRLAFEELFVLSLALMRMRSLSEIKTDVNVKNVKCVLDFSSSLPYELTDDQKCAVNSICADFLSGRPMNRLVQGDVGSGKTVVAACTAYAMAKNGYQSALMAPTEILATQHFEAFKKFYENHNISVCLLTKSTKNKKEVLKDISEGHYDVVIGTHSLIQDRVVFSNLGLCITDEQHRFGVMQRSKLSHGKKYPHVLVMSATPIPRTLSLMLYGDLDVSVISTLPLGRKPVETYCVSFSLHERIYSFMKKQIALGRQCFVVCPLVEQSEKSDLKSGTAVYETLCGVFGSERVSLVHGKMSADEKDAVMNDFKDKKTDVLVSTTVIEVGIDIPNASVIVIENAERFGLSQLHQLRGRVGRGSEKSYCILVSEQNTAESKERMKIMCATSNGFEIAQKDLEMRGCGEFFGTRQHGLPELKVANLFTDIDIAKEAQSAAADVLKSDPELCGIEYSFIKARIEKVFSKYGKIEIFN